ncbi:MAG TPA: sulfotransferase [Rhizomicrobium sp.]|nr:sulfotransferase [Rhizomicrobium sp.]
MAELLRLASEDAQADAAEAAAQACADVKWKKPSDRRILARLQKDEQKLLEPLKDKTEADAAGALREHLVKSPLDAVAMRWLARLEARSGDEDTACALLKRVLDICPAYVGARQEYCELLIGQREAAAVEETRRLLAESPQNPQFKSLHARALMDEGKAEAAIETVTELLRDDPHTAPYWLLYGNALRVTGRREEAVQAYRKCLDVRPDMGEAYLGLAELKDKVLTQADVSTMRALLNEDTLTSESRMHMLYALGQTLERSGDFEASFAAYEAGAREFWANEDKKPQQPEPVDELVDESPGSLMRLKAVFSRDNLKTRLVPAPVTNMDDTPIFVVGMPRAGSTLVEQILSAHSLVEGIGERSLISEIVRELAFSRKLVERNAYPDCLLEFTQDQLAALGARVIANSRNYRSTGRTYFVDKRPWNWLDVGLIHLILPQAKIIDVRREPMAACFAMYKQLLPRTSCAFSYDFEKLGAYYNRYVSIMDHWQSVLPGRVHFVQYERLVENTETEIRRMLDFCGLPFEEGCLRFWQVDRTIVTPSAEQVRRPIYRGALQQWRNFEPWLGPLKEALEKQAEI